MTLLIDNYDSFTYNLCHLIGRFDADVRVVRNDRVDVASLLAEPPDRIVLSPGPGRPEAAGCIVDIVRALGPRVPILGVCLGHQAIGAAFGAAVVRGLTPVHGKVSRIIHEGSPLFRGIPSPFEAVRYHSLIVEVRTLPPELRVTARSEEGEVMALEHATHPITGLQFHPESILTAVGERIIRNWFDGQRTRDEAEGHHSRAAAATGPDRDGDSTSLAGSTRVANLDRSGR